MNTQKNSADLEPINRKIGIVALVPDNWHGIWMPRHHVVGRLARHFDVVWIEPARGWRDYWFPGNHDHANIQSTSPDEFGLTLYSPGRWLPELYRPQWLARWIRNQRLIRAKRKLRSRGCTDIVLYLWRPEFDWAIDAIQTDLTCYHIDDEYRFSKNDLPNDPKEIALIKRVDLVIIHSQKLLEKKGSLNPNTVQIPNGVDYFAYATPAPEPTDVSQIPRPRIGYVGVIKSQLDLDLLRQLATRRPEWSFLLVGPNGHLAGKEVQLEELVALPNVYKLGNRQLTELPSYMQSLDVCLMCYEVCDYTNFIYPLKLNEYLATGRPVVSTPIDSALPLKDVLEIAGNLPEWEQAINNALSPDENTVEIVEKRQQQALLHDWDHLVNQIATHFRHCLNIEPNKHG